jgi:hypothetical protein
VTLEKAKMVRANILKILMYSFVFIENFLTSGIAGCYHNQHAPKASQLIVTARDFSKVEESDCFVNEAWYSTPQRTKSVT